MTNTFSVSGVILRCEPKRSEGEPRRISRHSAASFRIIVMRSAMAPVMKRAVIGVPS